MYTKKKLILFLSIEFILIVASYALKPIVDSVLEEFIAITIMLFPILTLLLIIAVDTNVHTTKRIIAIAIFVFLLITLMGASMAELLNLYSGGIGVG